MSIRFTGLRPRSLRARTILYLGAGTLLVAVLFAVATYLLARSYLLDLRVQGVQRRAAIDARLTTSRLETPGTNVADALNVLDPLSASAVLIHRNGSWFSSSLDVGADSVPPPLLRRTGGGHPGYQVVDGPNGEIVVVGIPLPSVGGELYEVAPLDDLVRSLNILGLILVIGTVIATAVGVGIGVWASRRVLEPLDGVATAAAQIAGGQLSRLEPTDDPDLVTIVGSFNSMVDALQSRIERDAAFAADVSHELRTPLTTLVAAVDLLQSRSDQMTSAQRQALDLTVAELERFRRLLDELIELARFDAGLRDQVLQPIHLRTLVEHSLVRRGLSPELVRGDSVTFVNADRARLERAFANLVDNADRYGGGVVAVELARDDAGVCLLVDDDGPGIPLGDRDRVFARFATSGGARGSARGTGLGLAIVKETAASLGGEVWCTDRPGGGARFVLWLPSVSAATPTGVKAPT